MLVWHMMGIRSTAAHTPACCGTEECVCPHCSSLAAAMGNADAVISAIGGSGDASTYHAVDNEVLKHVTLFITLRSALSSLLCHSPPLIHEWALCDLRREMWLWWMQR